VIFGKETAMSGKFNILIISLFSVLVIFGCSKKETQEKQDAAEDAASAEIKLPHKAASLDGLTYIKGQPVTLTEGKIYIVEYWATWCMPCRKSMPHLTELQKKYKDKGVTVIGITNETAEIAKPFVEKQGDVMDYTVAADPDLSVSKGYTIAFGQQFIPVAFVIDRKGDVVWVGNPQQELDFVVEQVVEKGQLEPEALAAAKAEKQKEMQEAIALLQKYFEAVESGLPVKEIRPIAEKIIANKTLPMSNILFFQMMRLDPSKQDTELARKYVKEWLANPEEQDIIMMDVAAKVLFDDGQIAKAVELQEKIVSMMSGGGKLDPNTQLYTDMMKKRLEEFKAAQNDPNKSSRINK